MTPFAGELRRVLTARGLSQRQAARDAGLTFDIINRYVTGRSVPMMRTAARLADALDAPRLLELTAAHRTITCEGCGASFVDGRHSGGEPRRFCTRRCSKRLRHRIVAEVRRPYELVVVERQRDELREAVAAMCRACTLGAGLCWDGDCPLRPVSPLPLADARVRVA